MYCIYSDADVGEEEGNWDHVFPLALGGDDAFAVWSSTDLNSKMGTRIDGALANDPLVEMAVAAAGYTGHRRKRRQPVWKKGTLKGRPVRVTWNDGEPLVWDARAKKTLSEHEFAERQMTAKLTIDRLPGCLFLVKTALAGGYFIYQDAIKQAIDLKVLRQLLFCDHTIPDVKASIEAANIRVCDRFHPDSSGTGAGLLFRAMCESLGRSVLLAVPDVDVLSFHVGIGGAFIGSILIPANLAPLPNGGEFEGGHCVLLAPGPMRRGSFRSLVLDFQRAVNEAANRQ